MSLRNLNHMNVGPSNLSIGIEKSNNEIESYNLDSINEKNKWWFKTSLMNLDYLKYINDEDFAIKLDKFMKWCNTIPNFA